MPPIRRRLSKEEFAERGDSVYETIVLPQLNRSDEGKFAAIDIESGEYDLDSDEMVAGNRLRARFPNSQIWMVRVGSRSVHRFGGRVIVGQPSCE